jgi:ribosomal protein S15P/S13E
VLYGKLQNLRFRDPPMKNILAWGEFDPPTKNDFINNKGAYNERFKINKMGVHFISEKQDNFRDPVLRKTMPKEDQVVDYLKNENQKLIMKKIYKNLEDKRLMTSYQTEKNALDGSQLVANLIDEVTIAGKPSYLPP